jgi:ATP-dependent RNA helicase DDX54/DBP10
MVRMMMSRLSSQSGVRACVLSPTRELALQTFKFVKEIGKYTGLRACLLVGGDSMEDQFALLHSNPDVYAPMPCHAISSHPTPCVVMVTQYGIASTDSWLAILFYSGACRLIATPGRLTHLLIEMNLNLSLCEYVVFDEADRLFEMGFSEQVTEITRRLPADRQTLLFSATLPKVLVSFAQAGVCPCGRAPRSLQGRRLWVM